MNIKKDIQELYTDPFVELIIIEISDDLTLYFCSSIDTVYNDEDSPGQTKQLQKNVIFDGNTYISLPLKFSGVQKRSTGTLPRPSVEISNIGNVIGVVADGIVGSTLKRIRTFEKYLDGKPEANPNAHFPIEYYYINSKSSHDNTTVVFELSSFLDKEGVRVPKRTVVRNSCSHSYRQFDEETNNFNYNGITCPYRGNRHFDLTNSEVQEKKDDRCSKTINGCLARFGRDVPLPIRAFPGVQE